MIKTGSHRGFFLQTAAGNLASMYYCPPSDTRFRAALLYIHPFGHELYHSRPVMNHLFLKMARLGISTLAPDLPGCGDSSGDLADARWSEWLSAAEFGFEWLEQQSRGPVGVVGLRLGAPLALDLANRLGSRCGHIILLDPVLSGEEMMTQFLRLRVAFSGLRNTPDKRETTVDLRKRLAAGESIEVAAHILHPEFFESIDRIYLAQKIPPLGVRVDWIQNEPSSNANEVADAWQSSGVPLAFHPVRVKPWWVHTRGLVDAYEPLHQAMAQIFQPCPT